MKTQKMLAIAWTMLVAGVWFASGGEWPQYGGPQRNFACSTLPAGNEKISETGWYASRTTPFGDEGGNGGVVVSGGRVYLYVNWVSRVPLDNYVVTPEALKALGASTVDRPPEAMVKDVEAARICEARETLEGHQVDGWAAKWAKDNLTTPETQRYAAWAIDRIKRGRDAVQLDRLWKLVDIRAREFAAQKNLDAWLGENGFTVPEKKLVRRATRAARDMAEDVIVCFDAFTGDSLWDARFPGEAGGVECSSTPCVVDGRCYVLGSGHLCCVDVKDGKQIFAAETFSKRGSSSPVVQDGKVYVISGGLLCFDATTGKQMWRQEAVKHNGTTPVIWTCAGKRYLICNGGSNELVCVNPADGAMLWKCETGGNNDGRSVLVEGDYAVVQTTRHELGGRRALKGYTGFRLSPTKVEKVWDFATKGQADNQTAVLFDEHVYFGVGNNPTKLTCLKAATGDVCWETALPREVSLVLPTVVDGKIVVRPSLQLYALHVTPEKLGAVTRLLAGYWLRAEAPYAVAYGRIYHRAGQIGCSPALREDALSP